MHGWVWTSSHVHVEVRGDHSVSPCPEPSFRQADSSLCHCVEHSGIFSLSLKFCFFEPETVFLAVYPRLIFKLKSPCLGFSHRNYYLPGSLGSLRKLFYTYKSLNRYMLAAVFNIFTVGCYFSTYVYIPPGPTECHAGIHLHKGMSTVKQLTKKVVYA